MQYADDFSTNEVAWGRLTLDHAFPNRPGLVTLQFDNLHAPALPWPGWQSSSAASHILRSMLSGPRAGVPLDGAFGTNPTHRSWSLISSDAYLAGLAGLLHMHWLLPGYQPDFCPPCGAFGFELRQVTATGQYLVRVFYTAQTFGPTPQLDSAEPNESPGNNAASGSGRQFRLRIWTLIFTNLHPI